MVLLAGRALRMEWTKLRTVQTSWWSLAGLIGLTAGLGAIAMISLSGHCLPDCDRDTPRLSLTGVLLGQSAVVVLAVLTISAEYETMMIRGTLAASPRRGLVLAAKAATVTAAVLGAGLLSVLGSLLVGRALVGREYPPISLADGPTLRAYLGTVLYLGLVALLSLGVATLVRHTAGGISVMLSLLYVAPIVSQLVSDPVWRMRLEQYGPMSAGLSIQATRHLDRLAIGPWAGLGVLAIYAAAAIIAGGIGLRLRDA
jgi:ABC-2 type transport system permease protein